MHVLLCVCRGDEEIRNSYKEVGNCHWYAMYAACRLLFSWFGYKFMMLWSSMSYNLFPLLAGFQKLPGMLDGHSSVLLTILGKSITSTLYSPGVPGCFQFYENRSQIIDSKLAHTQGNTYFGFILTKFIFYIINFVVFHMYQVVGVIFGVLSKYNTASTLILLRRDKNS